MKKILAGTFIVISFLILQDADAQFPHSTVYTRADTLRGSDGPGRSWWDVQSYDLDVKFNLADSTIEGTNRIEFKVLNSNHDVMQIDLQEPLTIDEATISSSGNVQKLKMTREGNVYFIDVSTLKFSASPVLVLKYHGKARTAVRPPWDGGISWRRDKNKNPWISISCQGLGASVWYPCKDYQGDEPEQATLHVTAPKELITVANGKLISTEDNVPGNTTYTWHVKNPINNYCIIPYIGKYTHFGELYKGEAGNLELDYWVLQQNKEKAVTQFKDVTRTMKAFEHWFGPYPFYEDGYKLVDAPYLGMEHQSAVAYGNGYQNGYAGTDLSASGWGMKFDFIIVHETAHEWWGNNLTTKDIADMWVHESFADYSETLFLEYHYGKKAANAYVQGIRSRIDNDVPIEGPYGVNKEGSGDMYYKGGNVIHTIRQVINNDEKFRQILRGLNKDFYHQIITGKMVEEYFTRKSGINFSKVFDQYLRTIKVPVLEWNYSGGKISYRWNNVIEGFNMPVKIAVAGNNSQFIYPTENWQQLKGKTLKADDNFYIQVKKV